MEYPLGEVDEEEDEEELEEMVDLDHGLDDDALEEDNLD